MPASQTAGILLSGPIRERELNLESGCRIIQISSAASMTLKAIARLSVLGLLLLEAPAFGQFWIDKRLTVQPIHVTDGAFIANDALNYFEAETNKIWAQAGIEVDFLSPIYYSSAAARVLAPSSIGADSLGELSQTPGEAWALPGIEGSTLGSQVVRMFFVESLGSGVLGYAFQSGYNLNPTSVHDQGLFAAVSDSAFTFNSGNGRRDVIAHELGHILAIGGYETADHIDGLGSGAPTNLMTAGSSRLSPSSLDDIYPDGGGYDQLTGSTSDPLLDDPLQYQIARARLMPVLTDLANPYTYSPVPEPSHIAALTGTLALAVAGIQRRRRRQAAER